ncbi:tRNA (adenosine(37)-N6)-threonylcarbamoyltransferase complex ATPase subunit type 1 TsaE [Luteibacter aegosomatissinici]|uniref:tRNA (adenosine(37)-N6)-threonylcarbamoyltransferase complex ATPase subunit type 1 TsaE n=1 Tax=Luteibacter aegosomatissinici TaxID=2911539 RepID=UPI001FF722C6|nr:tRNA (adenosine(37)-N6)-threonylcarbamoyltransferase complex ATPase subunit type 1 TsaE [Luteibacter aegosomatissinici]UPG95519.1 tRNA (adenosine(37)-N6)-threonylcarbamoyltransferase complex ATPase subunit type 1 TsaE [Luteibacter aegosomatissinici]
MELALPDEAATIALGRRLAATLPGGLVAFLHGDLGAGKTTFARAFLQALGVGERVKSPTYSLVEGYELGDRQAFHLDLYRIADPGELEWLGLDSLAEPGAVVLVEWPERGAGALPPVDLELSFRHDGTGRAVSFLARTATGRRVVDTLL